MSLGWGVYRQKPYGWQVRWQREAAWAALEKGPCFGRVAQRSVPPAGKVAPPCFRPAQDLACLLK